MARRDQGGSDVAFDDGGGLALDTLSEPVLLTGPHDGDDLDPEITDAVGTVDFGAVRVPVPARGTVTVEPTANGRMQAVSITLPEGRLSVSALAAPKSSKLWPQLVREIEASLRDGGARVRSFTGNWGRELHATSGAATSVFVGVDGPRWMLYGVATGPTADSDTLDGELRRVLRGTVVVRGKSPYPVRTILPLVVPEHLADVVVATESAAGKTAAPKKAAPKKAAPEKTAAKKTAPKKTAPQKTGQKPAQRAAETDAARVARTGAHPAAASTISTGPGPDAPLREQSPSARRAAAASWREGPRFPAEDGRFPAERTPPPVSASPPTSAEVAPTEALRMVEPGSGGRRRLREPEVEQTGRRHLRERAADVEPDGGRRRLREPGLGSGSMPEHPVGGRRRLRDDSPDDLRDLAAPDGPRPPEPVLPAAGLDAGFPEPGRGGRRRLREPDPAVAAIPPGGRRHLAEPAAGARSDLAAADGGAAAARDRMAGTAPWELDVPGGRRLREPDPLGGPAPGGRRRLREPEPEPVAGGRHDAWSGDDRPPADPDPLGIETGGRRRLREPDAFAGEPERAGRYDLAASPLDDGLGRPSEVPPDRRPRDPDVLEPGDRRSRDGRWEPDLRSVGAEPVGWPDGPADPSAGVASEAGGRRRRRELAEEPRPAVSDVPVAGTGGRRRRREAEPAPVIREGVPTEPWRLEPEWRSDLRPEGPPPATPDGDRGGRRTLGSEYLIETGVQEDFWAGDPVPAATPSDDGIAGRRRAGRHAAPEPGEEAPSTVPLRTLLGDLDARRAGGRHHR